jgi:MFS family permease
MANNLFEAVISPPSLYCTVLLFLPAGHWSHSVAGTSEDHRALRLLLIYQNYQTILYSSLGLDGKMPLILVGVWGTVGTIVSICGALLFDRLGRRKSFFISISGVMTGSVMLVIFWALYEASGNTTKVLGELAVFSMFVFNCGFAWIMNSMAYTYPPEILTTDIRATGMALGYGLKMGMSIFLTQALVLR